MRLFAPITAMAARPEDTLVDTWVVPQAVLTLEEEVATPITREVEVATPITAVAIMVAAWAGSE